MQNYLLTIILLACVTTATAQTPGPYALNNLHVDLAEQPNCVNLSWEIYGAQNPEDECPHYQIFRGREGEEWQWVARLEGIGYANTGNVVFQDCNFCEESGPVYYHIDYIADVSGLCDESVLDTLFYGEVVLTDFPCLRAVQHCDYSLQISRNTTGHNLSYCLPNGTSQGWIDIYDAAGHNLMRREVPTSGAPGPSAGSIEWQADVAAGVYLVMLRDDQGFSAAARLLRLF
jgi:hypothetical protein